MPRAAWLARAHLHGTQTQSQRERKQHFKKVKDTARCFKDSARFSDWKDPEDFMASAELLETKKRTSSGTVSDGVLLDLPQFPTRTFDYLTHTLHGTGIICLYT